MIPDLSPFLSLRRYVSIVHHVPGRIRLKLNMAALAKLPNVDPSPFLDLISRVQGVSATRVNKAALSVVVEYDSTRITFGTWERLLTADQAEVEQILRAHTA